MTTTQRSATTEARTETASKLVSSHPKASIGSGDSHPAVAPSCAHTPAYRRRSLGNNRPRNGYGAEGRAITANLAKHYALTNEFVAAGMDRDAASKKAMRIVLGYAL